MINIYIVEYIDTRKSLRSVSCFTKYTYDQSKLSHLSYNEVFIYKFRQYNVSCFSFQIEENLGMVMVFTIFTAIQEKMTDLISERVKRRKEEEERRIAEKEAEEQVLPELHLDVHEMDYHECQIISLSVISSYSSLLLLFLVFCKLCVNSGSHTDVIINSLPIFDRFQDLRLCL